MPRFMVLVKGDAAPDQMPSEEMLAEMGRYNEELAKAGVLLDLSGLHSSAEGVRVRFSEGGKTTVVDGPFAESKELVAGYWILQTKTKEEAIEWVKRAPFAPRPEYQGDPEIEIRQIFELDEFGESPAIDRARELEQELAKNRE
jgi:hypothetical protein